jgi:hypothetical protein
MGLELREQAAQVVQQGLGELHASIVAAVSEAFNEIYWPAGVGRCRATLRTGGS